MASASGDETLFEEFLAQRGHETDAGWDESYNKNSAPSAGESTKPTQQSARYADGRRI